MSRRLVANVNVKNPDTHQIVSILAGEDVPDWAAELIRNPSVWASDDHTEEPVAPVAPKKAPARQAPPVAVVRSTPVRRKASNGKSTKRDD